MEEEQNVQCSHLAPLKTFLFYRVGRRSLWGHSVIIQSLQELSVNGWLYSLTYIKVQGRMPGAVGAKEGQMPRG